MNRQALRQLVMMITLLLFPVTMNYLSPYVSALGASMGIVSGSLLVFAGFLLFSVVLGRAWCGWLCPSGSLNTMCLHINNQRVGRIDWIRGVVFTVWLATIVILFVAAGGIQVIDPFLMTESGISVDQPMRYIIYYSVLLVLIVLNVTIGRRGSCHVICWMSPFMTIGQTIGKLLRLPQLHLRTKPEQCIQCGKCTAVCPMSIDVMKLVPKGKILHRECVLCAECADACPKKVFSFGLNAYPLDKK